MGNVKIQIVDSDNGIEGNLELKESNNFPLSLTIKSGDIAQLSTRSGTFSTSFDIPQTKENNKLLGSLYHAQVKNTKEYFVKKDAIILVDENVFQRGKIRIEQVNKETYRAVFFGDNAEWIPLLKDIYLSDIGYDSTVTLTGSNIASTFANTSASDEYVMNYIDRGIHRDYASRTYGINGGSDANNTITKHVEEFNADLFVKQILNKGFNSIGYTFESDFFSADGSALIHSYISDNLKKKNVEDNYFEGTSSLDSSADLYPMINPTSSSWQNNVLKRLFVPIDTEISDVGNNFASEKYTAPREGFYDFEIDLDIELLLTENLSVVGSDKMNFHLFLYKENVSTYDFEFAGKQNLSPSFSSTPTASFEDYLSTDTINFYNNNGVFLFDSTAENNYVNIAKREKLISGGVYLLQSNTEHTIRGTLENIYMLENETAKIGICFETLEPFTGAIRTNILSGANLKITERENLVRNNTFNLKDVVDSSKHSITDIISDLTKTFNLYWRTDNKVKKVYCEPRNEFYKDLIDAKDWTSKIDVSNFSLIPLASKFARTLDFKYKEDSLDLYLQERNKKNGESFGSYSHDFGVNFKDGSKTISLGTYAPSYFLLNDVAHTRSLYQCARLWNQPFEEQPEFEKGFEPRLLNHVNSTNTWIGAGADNAQRFAYETQEADKKPTAVSSGACVGVFNKITRVWGNYEYSTTPKINLNFATINGQDGLFKSFYNKTFELISEGFLLKIKANLSKSDILNFKINDVIYFSAPYKIAGYWVLESMTNIKPNQDGLVTLNLIQHGIGGVTTEQASTNTEFDTSGSVPFNPKGSGLVSIDNQK